VSRDTLTGEERATIRLLRKQIPIQTANGVIYVTEEVDVYVHDLDITVTALLVENSPPLLSLGKIVKDHKYKYIWDDFARPYLQRQGGKKIYCRPSQNVPLITPATQDDATVGQHIGAKAEDGDDERAGKPTQDSGKIQPRKYKGKGPLQAQNPENAEKSRE
jgi:hypothetical protein